MPPKFDDSLRQVLRSSGATCFFRGKGLDVSKAVLKYYDEDDQPNFLRVGAAVLFLSKYVVAKKEGNFQEDLFPYNEFNHAIKICLQFCSTEEHAVEANARILCDIYSAATWLLQNHYQHYRTLNYSPDLLMDVYELVKNAAKHGQNYLEGSEVAERVIPAAAQILDVYEVGGWLVRERLYNLSLGAGDETLYQSVKEIILNKDDEAADWDSEQGFAEALRCLLLGESVDEVRKKFDDPCWNNRKNVKQALECVCRFEGSALTHYQAFKRLNAFIDADFKFDTLPDVFEEKIKGGGYRPRAYLDDSFNDYLKWELFEKSSLQGKACIVRAVQFRLLQMRLGGKEYDRKTCQEYCAILTNSGYGHFPSVLETLSYFDDGELCSYPQRWFDVDVVWQRIIDVESYGDKIKFFDSNHEQLRRFIYGADGKIIKDSAGLPQIVLDARAHVISKKLLDPKFTDRLERKRLLGVLEGRDSSVDYSYEARLRLTRNGEIDLLIEKACREVAGPLMQIYLESSALTNALTFDIYFNSSYCASCFIARAALTRLQKIAYVDSSVYSEEQRQHYLKIVSHAALNHLQGDTLFSETVNRLLQSFQFIGSECYSQARFDDCPARLIELSFYRGRHVGEVDDVSAVLCLRDMHDTDWFRASPKTRDIVMHEFTENHASIFSQTLELFEDYITRHEDRLKRSKSLPINNLSEDPINLNISFRLILLRKWLDNQKDLDTEQCVRVRMILAKICDNGRYDDRHVMYQSVVEERFIGNRCHFVIQNEADCGWNFKGSRKITEFLCVDNYKQGAFLTRLLFAKAVVCLFESETTSDDTRQRLHPLLEAIRQDDRYWDEFPPELQERLHRLHGYDSELAATASCRLFSRRLSCLSLDSVACQPAA